MLCHSNPCRTCRNGSPQCQVCTYTPPCLCHTELFRNHPNRNRTLSITRKEHSREMTMFYLRLHLILGSPQKFRRHSLHCLPPNPSLHSHSPKYYKIYYKLLLILMIMLFELLTYRTNSNWDLNHQSS